MVPVLSATFGSAPRSMRMAAVSKCALMMAYIRAVVPSGSLALRSALRSASAVTASAAPSRAAYMRGVQPPRGRTVTTIPDVSHLNSGKLRSFERSFVSAPIETSVLTAAALFCAAAHISAVCPCQFSRASIFAPVSTSSLMLSTLPVRAAVIRAVSPSGIALFGFAPALRSAATTVGSPFCAARRSGRQPVAADGVHLGARAQQHLNGRHVVGAHGPMQRRHAVGLAALTSAFWAMSAFTAAVLPCLTASRTRTPVPPAAPRLTTAAPVSRRHIVRFSSASVWAPSVGRGLQPHLTRRP